MSRIINICLDISDDRFLPYYDVLRLINSSKNFNVDTCCLEFFNSSLLEKNCEVIIHKYKESKQIIMSELFDVRTSGKYTNRFIREGHDLRKMLLAGEFKFV